MKHLGTSYGNAPAWTLRLVSVLPLLAAMAYGFIRALEAFRALKG